MRIGIDIDDCIADYTLPFLKKVAIEYGVTVRPEDFNGHSPRIEEYGFITHEQALSLLRSDEHDEFLLNLPVYSAALDPLKKMFEMHTIMILTSRSHYTPELIQADTKAWLEKHSINYHDLFFTDQKGQMAAQLGINIFVDDSLTYAKQVTSMGIPVILYQQPWNHGYQEFLGPQLSKLVIARTNNWEEISDLIEKNCLGKQV